MKDRQLREALKHRGILHDNRFATDPWISLELDPESIKLTRSMCMALAHHLGMEFEWQEESPAHYELVKKKKSKK
jgi:hypothetical protein